MLYICYIHVVIIVCVPTYVESGLGHTHFLLCEFHLCLVGDSTPDCLHLCSITFTLPYVHV